MSMDNLTPEEALNLRALVWKVRDYVLKCESGGAHTAEYVEMREWARMLLPPKSLPPKRSELP